MVEPKRQNSIDLLSKNFKAKFILRWDEVSKKYPNARVFESLRTKERQQWLYWVGRTHSLERKPITWTLVSKHLTWDAVDIVFNDSKWNPTWNWPYAELIEMAKVYGIDNLSPTETCHFQDNGKPLEYKLSEADQKVIKEATDANSALYMISTDPLLKDMLHALNVKIKTIYHTIY